MTADRVVPAILVGVIVLVAVTLVASSLNRPAPPSFTPSSLAASPAGDDLVGPIVYTVDARSTDAWTYFDFSRGSAVEEPSPAEWDIAFRRFNVVVNGGPGFAGRGGALDLGETPLDSVTTLPADGYLPSTADSSATAMERWYAYSWTSHLLTPLPRSWAVRTADGRFAALEFLGYYCPAAEPGCVTFRYRYQGSGSTRLVAGPGDPPP